MSRSLLFAVALAVPGLGACQVMVTAGRGMVDPVVVEHTVELGEVPPMCMPLEHVIETGAAPARLVVEPLEGGLCRVTVTVEQAELIDAEQSESLAEQLAQFDLSAVIAVEVVVDRLRLIDEDGRAIDAAELGDLVLRVDGARVYDRSVLQSPYEERVAIPDETRLAMIDALTAGTPLHADLMLVMTGPADRELPRWLRLDAQLQPIVHVDASGAL